MSCPDCKDGFYYPLTGPREPCQTCKVTIDVKIPSVEKIKRKLAQNGNFVGHYGSQTGHMLRLVHFAGITDFEITPDGQVLPKDIPQTYHELSMALSLLLNSNYDEFRFEHCFIVILRRMMQLRKNWGADDLAKDLKLSPSWVLSHLNGRSLCWPCNKCGRPKSAKDHCTYCTKVPDVSELICESRIPASKSSLQRLYRQFLSNMTIAELAQKLSKSPAHIIDILEGDHGEA